MILVISRDEFNLYELDSESELQEYVRSNNGVIIGNNIQVRNKFYIAEFFTDYVKNVIGILNEGHGIRPAIIKLENADVVVLSLDKSVYFFDLRNNKVIKSIACDSLVFDVIWREKEEKIFIVCELGIQSLTTKGDIIWTYDSDVITDFTFYESYIRLTVEDTEHIISLFNGKEI